MILQLKNKNLGLLPIAAAAAPAAATKAGGIISTVTNIAKNALFTDNVLIRARDRVLSAIRGAGIAESAYGPLLQGMGLTHSQIPNRRVGKNYNDLFAKLHEFAAQILGQVAKRPDLEAAFRANQPVYHDQGADTTYFSQLMQLVKTGGAAPASQNPTVTVNTMPLTSTTTTQVGPYTLQMKDGIVVSMQDTRTMQTLTPQTPGWQEATNYVQAQSQPQNQPRAQQANMGLIGAGVLLLIGGGLWISARNADKKKAQEQSQAA